MLYNKDKKRYVQDYNITAWCPNMYFSIHKRHCTLWVKGCFKLKPQEQIHFPLKVTKNTVWLCGNVILYETWFNMHFKLRLLCKMGLMVIFANFTNWKWFILLHTVST